MKERQQVQPVDPAGLEVAIGYVFRDRSVLNRALTHSSFCNETADEPGDNERLEFLGDAIISTVIAESAFCKFPNAPEGELTRLKSVVVAQPSLARTAQRIALGDYLRLGHGAAVSDRAATHPGVLCDALEALIGAIFLDGGYDAAKTVILALLAKELDRAREEGRQVDAKTDLQMLTYGLAHQPPSYEVLQIQGPPHSPTFTVAVKLPDGTSYSGHGRSKKEAQQAAAAAALKAVRPGKEHRGFDNEDTEGRD